MALNVDMDMEPFVRINPCGYANLPMCQISDFVAAPRLGHFSDRLAHSLASALGYNASELEFTDQAFSFCQSSRDPVPAGEASD